MPSMSAWAIALTIATGAIVVTAAADQPLMHMVVAGASALAFALLAIRDHNSLQSAAAIESLAASITARNCALVWAWGGLAILITYTFGITARWPEWWHFFLGFSLAAIASILFARLMLRDAQTGTTDASLLKVGRVLVMLQFVGVIGGLISMLFDGKFPRAVSHPDWAACNIFFFGGLSIAAISINALRTANKT